MDLHPGEPLARSRIAELLADARTRTLLLTAVLNQDELREAHDRIMSPIIWDLGHIAHFEEVWLLENIESASAGSEGLRGIYNPFEHPRATRDELPLPSLRECLAYMGTVRRAVLDRLARLDLAADTELLRDGFVFRMVLQHEYQHNETILQTLQLKRGRAFPAPRGLSAPSPAADAPEPGATVRFPGGEVVHGTDDRSAAYDNERPSHRIALKPFGIDAHPVTNGAYLAFVEDGGYAARSAWSDAGWAWLQEAGVGAPKHWRREDGGWTVRTMDAEGPLDPHHPVCHVGYWEAEAYARWAGKRLPTEFEWEAAASWDPESCTKRRFPWGDEPPDARLCNVDQLLFGTAPVGAYPAGVSPIGCWGMIGDVWEWTSSDFHGYPGYRTFPYPEYSEVFFGDGYKVLRGGSWATRPGAIRTTFRNWDYPIRRQIFAGFRCATDD